MRRFTNFWYCNLGEFVILDRLLCNYPRSDLIKYFWYALAASKETRYTKRNTCLILFDCKKRNANHVYDLLCRRRCKHSRTGFICAARIRIRCRRIWQCRTVLLARGRILSRSCPARHHAARYGRTDHSAHAAQHSAHGFPAGHPADRQDRRIW